ncbi:Hcp family type VI secretion system effector [Morganella morganii]|uniref:Hcp family type VI secretion system effector n=1 Tax=Morganella morganii TaxID=582 RepID=UPI001BDA82A9|nr:Hcp family type VI secretion system effector [Morganella morganii]MBT0422615.1 Hcp family type VI secretion system effector [Morganella morganii subsp. morganii]MBT0517244.1 Hcp family type VI secretion system effector [Morganella morganii subsp. morganii]UNJ79673.1 Secreted protein Hcp [Morganella morganii]
MADLIYLTMNGNKQGSVSAGCSSYDSIGNRYQQHHVNEIFVYSTDYELSRGENMSHGHFVFSKADDKASPLLLSSITSNELFECDFKYYRTTISGGLIHYKTIKLTRASIVNIINIHPDSLTNNEQHPKEIVSLKYESITANHHIASTSGYSITTNN